MQPKIDELMQYAAEQGVSIDEVIELMAQQNKQEKCIILLCIISNNLRQLSVLFVLV